VSPLENTFKIIPKLHKGSIVDSSLTFYGCPFIHDVSLKFKGGQ